MSEALKTAAATVPMKLIPPAQPAGICTALASLPGGAHLDARGLAAALGVSKKTVERSLRRGELPAPFKLGNKHVWLVSTILQHFENRQRAALEKQDRHAKNLAQR